MNTGLSQPPRESADSKNLGSGAGSGVSHWFRLWAATFWTFWSFAVKGALDVW